MQKFSSAIFAATVFVFFNLALASVHAAEAGKFASIGWFLAGLDQSKSDQSKESRPLNEATNSHASYLDARWKKFEAEKLGGIKNLAASVVKSQHDVAFYFFSGPDFPYVNALFPNAKRYVLSGLEPAVLPVEIANIASDPAILFRIRASLRPYFEAGFFNTNEMLWKDSFAGALPLLMVFLSRAGYDVQNVRYVSIDDNGVPSFSDAPLKGANGLQIIFADGQRETKELYYFRADLADGATSSKTFLKFCDTFGEGVSLLKSASYLLHQNRFSDVRKFILSHSSLIVEDDTGIPVRYLDRSIWQLRLYGRYRSPVGKFVKYDQPELRSLMKSEGDSPTAFATGYLRQIDGSHFLVAKKR